MIFIKFFAWSVFTRIPVWAVCKLNNCNDIVRVEIVLAAGVFRGGSIPLFLLSWLLPLHCFQCLYCHFFIITFRQPFFMFLSWKRLNLTTWFIFCIDSSKILFQLPRLSVHGGPWSVVRGGPWWSVVVRHSAHTKNCLTSEFRSPLRGQVPTPLRRS